MKGGVENWFFNAEIFILILMIVALNRCEFDRSHCCLLCE